MQSDIRLTTRSVVIRSLVLLLLLSGLSTACNRAAEPPPRGEAVVEVETQPTVAPATWTPVPAVDVSTSTAAPTLPPPPTTTPPPTSTPLPATETPTVAPTETPTATPQPTNTPRPAPTLPPAPAQPPAQPTLPPNPVLGVNLLPNPSFEEGHYNQNGIPELQLPNGWRVEFTEGATGFGGQTWDVYVRPEIRVLSAGFLPESEHALYIFDGGYTVKLFKGAGAVNARLVTDVELQPGVYVLEASFFSDVFERYEDGQKFAPSDPFAGEAALFAGQTGTGWIPNNYLRKNTLQHTFKIDTAQKVPVGIALRGRYAIANNGWFLDNLFLRRVE